MLFILFFGVKEFELTKVKFQAELDAFQKLSKTKKTKKSRNRGPKKMDSDEAGDDAAAVGEGDEELKPLPDILSFFTNQMAGKCCKQHSFTF